MTAAADATHRTPNHPLGPGGIADSRTALQGGALPPTPPEAPTGLTAAPVILDFVTPPAEHRQAEGSFAGVWRLPVRAYSRGDRLYEAETTAEAAYIIEAGLVALELNAPRPRIVALAGPGDVVGALAPGHGAYLESATALSGEVAVRVVDERTQAELSASEFSALLLGAAAARVITLTHALEDGEEPVPARVARALLRLGTRFGQTMEDGTVRLTLPLTHDTLAAMVGAARETTTAVVSQLREAHLVDGTRGSYRIRPAQLAEFALEAALAAGR